MPLIFSITSDLSSTYPVNMFFRELFCLPLNSFALTEPLMCMFCWVCCFLRLFFSLSMATIGQPDTLLCEFRLLLTWPLPWQPGVGHFRITSWFWTLKKTTILEINYWINPSFDFLLCRTEVLSLRGQPDKLLWCEYRPVTWPVPSQPSEGHLESFVG